MYYLRSAVILMLAVFSATLTWAQQTIPVSIFTRNGLPAPGFTNMDFEGSYKGKAVRVDSVTVDEAPRRIILLLDISGSMLGTTTDADWNFPLDVAQLLLLKMPPSTEIGLATFNTELRHVEDLTGDRKKLVDAVETVRKSRREFGEGDTAVWDSIIAGAKLFDHPRAGDSLYLISDGIDNRSKASSGDVIEALTCRGIRLFAFALADRRKIANAFTPASATAQLKLRDLADDAGGRLAVVLRPSSADYHGWSFVDKAGNPTELTAGLFGQFQQILNVYLITVDLPERLYKPQDWRLDYVGSDRSTKGNLILIYPHKLVSCD